MKAGFEFRKAAIGLLKCLTGILLILLGIFGMKTIAAMKEPLPQKSTKEQPILVETITARETTVTPYISGFGELMSVEVVPIAPEIPGKVIQVHPRLSAGEVIAKGELLFSIDTEVTRLDLTINRKRLDVIQRNLKIAKREHDRMRILNENDTLVAARDVEKAEQAMNALSDQVYQLEHAIESSQLMIRRSRVTAPFDGRIKSATLEMGQYVSAGAPVITLSNDRVLEMRVAFDGSKVMNAISFTIDPSKKNTHWLPRPTAVPVEVIWDNDQQPITAIGKLDRVVEYDAKTRTLITAIRVDASGTHGSHPFSLMEGMFCEARVPGRALDHVFEVPRNALYDDERVFLAVNNRIKTQRVTVASINENVAYISHGLTSDEEIIVTRLASPLENALVKPVNASLMVSTQTGN